MVNRFEIYLINLDAEPSKNAKNSRPGVIVSPNEMNHNIANVLVAPLSVESVKYPTRVPINFLNSERVVILDQMRTVDKVRLGKLIGEVEITERKAILDRLAEFFAE